jgi:membrane-bound lytic murein transglycosylase D
LKLILIIAFLFSSQWIFAIYNHDTLINQKNLEDSLINAIISDKAAINAEKVMMLSTFTKNGFKDLFSKLDYNTSMPYSSQVNPNAETFMRDYLQKHSKNLIQLKSMAGPYFGLIENIFKEYGLPTELKYLAVIESYLDSRVTSWAGAAGPWQFMPETAKMYGLVVKPGQDERRDYFKSTHAAAQFLLKLFKEYHDWLLVIAAYNGGPGRVNNAISKAGSRNFWNLQYYLPEESRNHVKKFIATHYVMESNNNNLFVKNDSKINNRLSSDQLTNSLVISITGKYNKNIIVKHLKISTEAFDKYNPNFEVMISRDGTYPLRLSQEMMNKFLLDKQLILEESVHWLLYNNQ